MRIGLLFPGEMGAELGAVARADVLWASEGRSEATARRAARAGFQDARTVGELVARSEVVLSICPPAVAEGVAAEVAGLGFRGLYVDANAVAPTRMGRIAAMLSDVGAEVIDASVIGRTGLHLYLSGPAAGVDRVAELFAGTTVEAIPLPGGVGAASALKMAFGGWNKIGIALTAQAHAVARAYGVEDALASEGVGAERIAGAAARAWRWAPEMEEVADTCADLGLPDALPRGAAEFYERWQHHRDAEVTLSRLFDELQG
jgi:3-hydroxyisobutyrate dehydrogenase-like beta-hydroxyacid dehydrogenase